MQVIIHSTYIQPTQTKEGKINQHRNKIAMVSKLFDENSIVFIDQLPSVIRSPLYTYFFYNKLCLYKKWLWFENKRLCVSRLQHVQTLTNQLDAMLMTAHKYACLGLCHAIFALSRTFWNTVRFNCQLRLEKEETMPSSVLCVSVIQNRWQQEINTHTHTHTKQKFSKCEKMFQTRLSRFEQSFTIIIFRYSMFV